MKVYIVGGQDHYGLIIKNAEFVTQIEDADLAIFTGGADVDPELYGENLGKHTGIYPERDASEILTFNEAQKLKVPCLGVCRGSQLLTVLSGGSLIQHVNNHAIWGTHEIETTEGKLNITSTHHQMMYPYDLSKEDFTLVGWVKKSLSNVYLNGDNKNHKYCEYEMPEPEIVKYHKTNCLCIQGHPEMLLTDEDFMVKIRFIISKYLLNGK